MVGCLQTLFTLHNTEIMHINRALYSVNVEEHFFLLEKINFHVNLG